jgi:hypothetical protein
MRPPKSPDSSVLGVTILEHKKSPLESWFSQILFCCCRLQTYELLLRMNLLFDPIPQNNYSENLTTSVDTLTPLNNDSLFLS